ncbi:hypothetical protein [Pseudomonas qingdaonensis]|uniref:hypothetical protein n=1 Tax=Pseudomonas qingdaonensis TaxID=2056231 RepID=UPI000C28E6C5|nr:hypothetical protein [Pseudomonas qingdaonensis]
MNKDDIIENCRQSIALYEELANLHRGKWCLVDGLGRVVWKLEDRYVGAQINPHTLRPMVLSTSLVADRLDELEWVLADRLADLPYVLIDLVRPTRVDSLFRQRAQESQDSLDYLQSLIAEQ